MVGNVRFKILKAGAGDHIFEATVFQRADKQ